MSDRWMEIAFRCLREAEEWVKNNDCVETHHFVEGERVLEMIVERK